MNETLLDAWGKSGIRVLQGAEHLEKSGDRAGEIYRFHDYVTEEVKFTGLSSVLDAARNFLLFYGQMLQHQFVYAGDLRQTLWIEKATGKILFTDMRNVYPFGERPFYPVWAEAPEILLGNRSAALESEYWTIAVYLYELFFHSGSPLRGKNSMQQVFLSMEEEYRWMAANASFNMAPKDHSNSPVHGVQDRLIKYWNSYPEGLRETFIRAFFEGKNHPEHRPGIQEWQDTIHRVKAEYLECECGHKGFTSHFMITEDGHFRCPKCGNMFYRFESCNRHMYLYRGMNLYQYQILDTAMQKDIVIGQVVENKNHPGVYGIKNVSDDTWRGTGPDGAVREIPPQAGIPISRALSVTFPDGATWSISSGNQKNPNSGVGTITAQMDVEMNHEELNIEELLGGQIYETMQTED